MRGATLQSLRCVVFGKKNCISYNSRRFSVVIASVGFNIDRVTTQHTPKCAENCSENKYLIIVLLTPTRFSVSLVITLKTAWFFFSTVDKLFVLKRCIPCAQNVMPR